MNLNFKPEDVFGPQDVYEGSEVRQYIGKKGYFGDNLKKLQESVTVHDLRTLEKILEGETYPYQYGVLATQAFGLFLPADTVIAPIKEKKYRPFSRYSEFMETTNVSTGESIRLRPKDSSICRVELLCGFSYDSDEDKGLIFASLGCISFQKLFDDFEYHKPGWFSDGWLPFGVEITEE